MTKRSFKVDEEILEFLNEIQREYNLFSVDEAHFFWLKKTMKGKVPVDAIEDPCKNCPKPHLITPKGIICITKKAENDQIYKRQFSFAEARACAEKPFNTPLDKKTREQFERDLSNMEKMKNYHQQRADELRPKAERLPIVERQLQKIMRELEEASKGKEELLNAKNTLESRVSELQNSLIALMDEKAKLEAQVTQLTQLNKELSQDALAEKNSFLTVELGKRDRDIERLKAEVERQEALIEVLKQRVFQVTSEIEKMLREFGEFIPSDLGTCEQCVDSFQIKDYFRNTKKKIEAFKGYLQTITT
jgi:DNA repair exonuclease SbcCD ATPase subunit